jgi:regulator of protease activity HflC (stomatin/prohibitin superfamily)
MVWMGLAMGLALYGLYVLGRSSFRVEEGHLAVLTTFGAAEVDEAHPGRLKTWGPGLHFKRPWQKVIFVSMKEQNLDLSGEEGGRTAMAEDGTLLRFDSILRYVPVESELARFLFGMRSPLDHITGLFTCLLRNEIANFSVATERDAADKALLEFEGHAGSYALIRRERARLNLHIEDFCRTQIGDRYGVRFNAVDLTDILAPDELADALNAVIQAQSDAEARYFRAEGDCKQRVLAAEKGVSIARSRAQAVSTEILTLASFLEALKKSRTLGMYIERRRAEVLSESRATFVKEGA